MEWKGYNAEDGACPGVLLCYKRINCNLIVCVHQNRSLGSRVGGGKCAPLAMPLARLSASDYLDKKLDTKIPDVI